MNLLEIYVSNITKCELCQKIYDGHVVRYYKMVADKDCYGSKQSQVEFIVSESNYQSIMKNGFYMG